MSSSRTTRIVREEVNDPVRPIRDPDVPRQSDNVIKKALQMAGETGEDVVVKQPDGTSKIISSTTVDENDDDRRGNVNRTHASRNTEEVVIEQPDGTSKVIKTTTVDDVDRDGNIITKRVHNTGSSNAQHVSNSRPA